MRGQSIDTNAPIGDVAPALEMLAAEEVLKLKKTQRAGELVGVVKSWHQACKSARIGEERQWLKDFDMYQGRQFSMWSDSSNSMVTPPVPDFEPRVAINIIEPKVRTELAKTAQNHPKATVLPGSNDDTDKLAAIAAENACEWFTAVSRFQTNVYNPANLWRTVTGNGFIKTYYDPSVTDESATEAAKQAWQKQAKEQAGQGIEGISQMPPPGPVKGKICAKYITPFHLFVPDLAEVNLQEQAYVQHAYTIPYERAKIAYADYVPKDWEPTLISANTILDVSRIGVKGGNSAVVNSVLCIETWVKPGVTSHLPLGGLIITVADEIVGLAENGIPYKHGQFPFAHITSIDTGRFYRKSIVNSLTALQNETNRTYAQLIKAKNLAVKPQFFYDEGSLDPRLWRSKAGSLIPIRLGMKYPQRVDYPDIPMFVIGLMDQIKIAGDDISGQHQVSRAISPGADTAASALALLQETDDAFLSTAYDSIEAAMETIYGQFLALAVQYWDVPRLIKVVGEDSPFDAQLLSSAELTNGTDVRVEGGTALPVSKAGRIAVITDWIDKGIVPPEIGLEAMEMGTLGKVFQRIKIDRDQAMRENIEMRKTDISLIQAHQAEQAEQAQAFMDMMAGGTGPLPGEGMDDQLDIEDDVDAVDDAEAIAPASGGVGAMGPGPVQPPREEPYFPIGWQDNHVIHAQEHRDYAKSQSFKSLPQELQLEFQLHTEAHDQAAAELMAMQAMVDPLGDVSPTGPPAPDSYADSTDQTPV